MTTFQKEFVNRRLDDRRTLTGCQVGSASLSDLLTDRGGSYTLWAINRIGCRT
jgi:hypothetical protein